MSDCERLQRDGVDTRLPASRNARTIVDMVAGLAALACEQEASPQRRLSCREGASGFSLQVQARRQVQQTRGKLF